METGVRIYNVEPLMEKGHLGVCACDAVLRCVYVNIRLYTRLYHEVDPTIRFLLKF